MTSSSAIHVNVGHSWITIQLDKLRLAPRFRARLFEIDNARNPLIADAVIGSQERHCSSKEHAR